ncbi:hypothetical protein Ppa06_61990 [Planomonospora parontospora subsp. parontospora]|uniref:Integral membrane protein n=2 Tax=Planomonospora parontospora TaxID=58119 RepID=A0AA37BN83_9ACTN|nr:hypothetical protein [Planomonospora parontospora]GGK93788.1 hypothetical protein GCM10010126_61460 [Planomonospora parontospora]GII12401.1 hypothetical protein Ppa06_61990 [Planomonospora parontospora subsp. parontospora]
MVLAVIIACEVGFWVLLALGLAFRYLWGMRRLSAVLLLCVPLLDVVLLVTAVIDMRGGAQGSWHHGLAAAYLAYSVVFGHRTLKWADARFAHRFAGGPEPERPPAGGTARTRYEWVMWIRIAVAYGLGCAVLYGLILMVGDPSRTAALNEFMIGASKVPLIALLWPLSYTLFPKKVPDGSQV